MNQNNQEIIELLQNSQKVSFCALIIGAIPTFILLWDRFKKKDPNNKIRLIRKEGQIKKIQSLHKSRMEQLFLDRETILKEISYESEKMKLETSLDGRSELNNSLPNLDLLTNLKEKGENLIKDKINFDYKEKAEQIITKINEPNKIIEELQKPAKNKEQSLSEEIKDSDIPTPPVKKEIEQPKQQQKGDWNEIHEAIKKRRKDLGEE